MRVNCERERERESSRRRRVRGPEKVLLGGLWVSEIGIWVPPPL